MVGKMVLEEISKLKLILGGKDLEEIELPHLDGHKG